MVGFSARARETGCLSGTGSTAMKRQVQLHTDESARGEAEEMRPELQRKPKQCMWKEQEKKKGKKRAGMTGNEEGSFRNGFGTRVWGACC